LKEVYGYASIVGNSRVVFNIKGNTFRIVVKIRYDVGFAYVIWFGTHREYDEIDVETINFGIKS
jgi:mRNA interferase HigB